MSDGRDTKLVAGRDTKLVAGLAGQLQQQQE